jgi:hypothetical protein
VPQKPYYLSNNLSIFNGEVGRVFETPILGQNISKTLCLITSVSKISFFFAPEICHYIK